MQLWSPCLLTKTKKQKTFTDFPAGWAPVSLMWLKDPLLSYSGPFPTTTSPPHIPTFLQFLESLEYLPASGYLHKLLGTTHHHLHPSTLPAPGFIHLARSSSVSQFKYDFLRRHSQPLSQTWLNPCIVPCTLLQVYITIVIVWLSIWLLLKIYFPY